LIWLSLGTDGSIIILLMSGHNSLKEPQQSGPNAWPSLLVNFQLAPRPEYMKPNLPGSSQTFIFKKD
jgi:hypothetical protein